MEEGRDSLNRIDHLFTGKELDDETGLYYFGARYLDPKTSRWMSSDPAMEKYLPEAPMDDEARKRNGNLPGVGGVFNAVNLASYHYAGNNPLKYVDPNGRDIKLKHQVIGINQRETNGTDPKSACGPVSLTMALNYQGYKNDANYVINIAVKKGYYIPKDPQKIYTSPVNLTKIAKTFTSDKKVNSYTGSDVTIERIKLELSNDNPVVADVFVVGKTMQVAPKNTGITHFIVITGVDDNNRISYMDPWDGTQKTTSWDDLKASFRANPDGVTGGYLLVVKKAEDNRGQ